jgi:hypothetical protein
MKSEPAASKMLIVNDTGPAAMHREINRESSLPIIAMPAEPTGPRSRYGRLLTAMMASTVIGSVGFSVTDWKPSKEITPDDTARLEAARVKRERRQARKP